MQIEDDLNPLLIAPHRTIRDALTRLNATRHLLQLVVSGEGMLLGTITDGDIRRTLVPQREVVNKLARDTFLVIGEKDQVYFRDVYDHMVRLYNQSDSVRDLLTGTMELNLSVMNNRMNDVMKTLTIITTLFMPLTFITGFFGMNFFQAVLPLRVWTGSGTLAFTLVGMILLPLGMFYWMRRRAWM